MRRLNILIGFLFFILTGLATAQELREGRDYVVLNPAQPTDARGKIEVTEFFWYGCPHCFGLEPYMQKWLKALPKDVSFRRVHALFPNGRWANDAKTFYTLEAMGLLEKMHGEVFQATHVERLRLNEEATLFAWMEKKGVDRKKFEETYRSFAIQSKTQRAIQMSQAHGLDGVPTVVVQGKYKPVGAAAPSPEELLAVVDKLIVKARAELPK